MGGDLSEECRVQSEEWAESEGDAGMLRQGGGDGAQQIQIGELEHAVEVLAQGRVNGDLGMAAGLRGCG